jgi:glycosyltransferase involved in cell wall biosynthesis
VTLCYLANARLPSEKAHGLQIAENCDALAAEGVDVTLVLPRRFNSSRFTNRDPWSYYGLEKRFAIRKLACVDLFPLGRWAARLAAPLQSVTYACSTLLTLRRLPSDRYYSREILLLLAASVVVPREALVYEAHQLSRSRAGVWLQRLCLRRTAHIVAVTESLADRLRARGGRQVVVIPDGFREDRFANAPDRTTARRRLALPDDAFLVGYVGRLETMGMSKGLDWLVDAVAALADPRVHVCVVGGPFDAVRDVQGQWERRGLALEKFHAAGEVAPGAVPEYLAAFDVCALPLPATEHFSSAASPLKLFEYMASGGAIVASGLPSIAEILRHEETALFVPPGDVPLLAAAIARLRDDPALRARLGHAARLDSARFSWRARARRVLQQINR